MAVVAKSALERTLRLDAEFFKDDFTSALLALSRHNLEPLTDTAKVSDGNHFTISDCYTEEGIPYYRGQDISGTFFAEQAKATFITPEAYQRPYMKRSHLQKGDVLLSIVGTIGSVSLFDSDDEATCSCKLAILRPKSILPEYLAAYLSSSFGQNRIRQLTRGALQGGLTLVDMDQFDIPRFGELEEAVAKTIQQAKAQTIAATQAQQTAEATLIEALGLGGWSPPEPLTYTRSAAAVRIAGRFDSQFHAPAVSELELELSSKFEMVSLGELGEVTSGRTVQYSEAGTIPIVRSGNVGKNVDPAVLLKATAAEPSFALNKGDVLISSIGFGSIGRVETVSVSGLGTVSEVTVLRQADLDPYYLAAYLRSFAGQIQIERYITGATGQLHLYPRDVRSVFVPRIEGAAQLKFRELAEQGELSRNRAQSLLTTAKRAVEIAIEESEGAALAFLEAGRLAQ